MFGLNKRVIAVIFGILALAFAVGAILLFTPQAGQNPRGRPVLYVNGKPLYELDLLRLQGNDPLYSANPQGLLKALVDTHFLEQVILTEALKQDAARVRVSGAEVRKEVERIREQFGLRDKKAYDQFLNQIGYTDAQLRGEVRVQLQIQKRLEEIRNRAKPTPEEVQFYYEVFKDNYQEEPRVLARQIVVDDAKLAEEIKKKLEAGQDFAELAKAYSKVGAEALGALGAEPGKTEPKPVTRVIFPEAVAEAVFALKGPGLVGPIEAAGRLYFVKVEEYLPAKPLSFEEAKARVEADAQAAEGEGALEAYLEELRRKAQVRFTEASGYRYENQAVAKVNGQEILLARVLQPVFGNPQVAALLQQGLGELAVQFFLPATLENLIETELLVEEAKKTGRPFIGTKEDIAQAYLLYATQEVQATEEEAKRFYAENPARFTVPAQAKVVGVSFTEEAKAKAFREAALKASDLEALAKAHGGQVTDYGAVNPGGLPTVLNRLVFLTKESFPKGPLGEVSEVVKLEDGTHVVLLVSDRRAERLRPYAEVAEEARRLAREAKRQREAERMVAELKDKAQIENRLNEVLQALAPKEEAPQEEATPPGEGKPGPETPAQP